MSGVSAQVSLYPLGQEDVAPAVEAVLRVFRMRGLDHEVGAMSTLLWGDDQQVFAALQEAYRVAAAIGPAVMVVTLSNACPVALPPKLEEPNG